MNHHEIMRQERQLEKTYQSFIMPIAFKHLIPAEISGGKIASRYSVWSKDQEVTHFYKLDEMVENFYQYWLEKDQKYVSTFEKHGLIAAIKIYFAKKIWGHKSSSGDVYNDSLENIVYLGSLIKVWDENNYKCGTKLITKYIENEALRSKVLLEFKEMFQEQSVILKTGVMNELSVTKTDIKQLTK